MCIKTYASIEKPTPCDKCRPKLLSWSMPYIQLYTLCSDQYVISNNGAIGLNFLAVDRAMDYYEIDQDERLEFYEKVRLIASTVLELQHQAAKAELEANKRKAAPQR